MSKLNIWETCLSGEGLKSWGDCYGYSLLLREKLGVFHSLLNADHWPGWGLYFMVRLFQPFLSTLMWAFPPPSGCRDCLVVAFRVFSEEVVPYVAADLMFPREEESPRTSYVTILNWLKT